MKWYKITEDELDALRSFANNPNNTDNADTIGEMLDSIIIRNNKGG